MLSYCLKCRKNKQSKNPAVMKRKNGRIMLLSECAVCDNKKSKFIKWEEPIGLSNSLGKKAPLSKSPLIDPLLFSQYKMNKIIKKNN